MGLMSKLKGAFASVADMPVKADRRDLMEAMAAAGCLMGYSNGEPSDKELGVVKNIIQTSKQLQAFGKESIQVFDGYCDQMEASKRMGKMELLKEIREVSGEDAERVMIMAIEVADASGDIDDAETKMLHAIADALDVNFEDYV